MAVNKCRSFWEVILEEEAGENEEEYKESHRRQSDQGLQALCQEGNTQIQGATFAKCIFQSETVDW